LITLTTSTTRDFVRRRRERQLAPPLRADWVSRLAGLHFPDASPDGSSHWRMTPTYYSEEQ
jgi:hypothetical protein